MIGKAYISTFPYFDKIKGKMSFKNRPVLVIGAADDKDFVVLPISRVTNSINLDSYYDIPISPNITPLMNLKTISYIRTHKQTIINVNSLTKQIVDFKAEYPDLYIEVLSKIEEFQNNLINRAL